MPVRGIRGATTIDRDIPEVLLESSRELLEEILHANPGLKPENMAACIFTVTPDIKSAFPAQAARQLGWQWVPLMSAQEIPVPGSIKACIRVLILWNTEQPQGAIKHVYLKNARSLRPDLSVEEVSDVNHHAS
jgi:chorismate mutase